jgi:hypothetical protein
MESLVSLAAKQAAKEEELAAARTQVRMVEVCTQLRLQFLVCVTWGCRVCLVAQKTSAALLVSLAAVQAAEEGGLAAAKARVRTAH